MADSEQTKKERENGGNNVTTGDVGNNTDNHNKIKSKRKRRGRNRRDEREHPKIASGDTQQRPDTRSIVMENENLVKFYKAQKFVKEDEFDAFLQMLRTTLPASFRINAFEYEQAQFLRRLVKGSELCDFLIPPTHENKPMESGNGAEKNNDHHESVKDIEQDGSGYEENDSENDTLVSKSTTGVHRPPTIQPLCWYPRELAWQMNVTRIDLKKSPLLSGLHKFIMSETENGFISRQESVSMIPPLLLDVRRGHNVLDMCAAPGSKTAQLLEYLKFDIFDSWEHAKVQTKDIFDDGLVVANDVDNKRCYMLVHQANRLNSPNCVVINEDASKLPNMKIYDDNCEVKRLKFDRILCDVPCSGDGTVRKNPDVWRKWSVANANNFHGMQTKIVKRGLELLNEGGILVYSTCSMNPTEDESVVASILRATQGRVQLEDVSTKLKGLIYRPGISDWVVFGRDTEPIPSLDQVKPDQASQIYSSLFPPSKEEIEQFHLDRCVRILPHLQNTGAFFVAVLRKSTSTLPWEDESKAKEVVDEEPKAKLSQPQQKKRRYGGFKEDPFFSMEANDPDWLTIKKAFGLDDKFPADQLIHRCQGAGKKRSISLASKKTRDFMMVNQETPEKKDFVKLINGGMRLFARAGSEVGFRICQDGVHEIAPYVKGELKVPITKDDLTELLKARSIAFEDLNSGAHIRDNLDQGSFILLYNHTEPGQESFEIQLAAWKGEKSVALYVSKTYRVHLCALVQLRLSEAALT